MVSQEKIISEANKYVMPAVDDYLAARCLLLNNIFVGLTLAHEATEKLIKALLILEDIKIPKSCHNVSRLAKLLSNKDSVKYKLLIDSLKFMELLDQHYAWRYHDGDITKRSRSRSTADLQPFDNLWVALYIFYMDFLPEASRFSTYFLSFLFDKRIREYTNWSEILLQNNEAVKKSSSLWKTEYEKIFDENTI